MMMTRRIFTYLILAVGISSYAQNKTLSIDECIALAKENAPAIRAAREKEKSTYHLSRSVKSMFLPQISATGTGFYSDAKGGLNIPSGMLPVIDATGIPTGSAAFFPGIDIDYNVDFIYGAGIKVEQPIYMGGKIRHSYNMSRIGQSISSENTRMTTMEVIISTSQAYASLVKAIKMKEVATSYPALLKELMRSVEKAHAQGLKQKNDLLKVKVKLSESELNIHRAENAISLASMNLCHHIGLPLDHKIDIIDSLPLYEIISTPSSDVSSRPEYQMLKQRTLLAKKQVQLSRSESLPQIGLIGQYGYTHGLDVLSRPLFDGWNIMAGVQVNIPLYSFGRHSQKTYSAKALYNEAIALEKQNTERMILEATQSYNRLEEAVIEMELALKTEDAARENMRVSSRLYEEGMENLSDLLESQSLWEKARTSSIESSFNLYIQQLLYLKSIGELK